ncbi:MAG TPA: tetratricopeptide repeat protein [Terriglobales bacterium]|nr:tetratricopeptide repeat protein [Terriglobales bacterium]
MATENDAPRRTSGQTWTSTQAYVLALVCLLAGIAVGYLVRGSGSTAAPPPASTQAAAPAGLPSAPQPTPEQMAHMAQKQVEPLLARLKTDPKNAGLLAQIGNAYYDAQQYSDAITYYQKSLAIRPQDVDVRSDMGSCYFYTGDTDRAISEFEKGLKYNPSHAGTLFNMGIVKWQGRMDPAGALQAWEKLLQTNPDYPNKAKVEDLIARARQHAQGGMTGMAKN